MALVHQRVPNCTSLPAPPGGQMEPHSVTTESALSIFRPISPKPTFNVQDWSSLSLHSRFPLSTSFTTERESHKKIILPVTMPCSYVTSARSLRHLHVPLEHLACGALNKPGFCSRSDERQFTICILPPPKAPPLRQVTTHYFAAELTNDITSKFNKTYTKRNQRTRQWTNSVHLPHPKTPFPCHPLFCKFLGGGLKALLLVMSSSVFSTNQQLNF